MLLSSLRTKNMLLFCRRMCHQLLLASNCFLSTSFLQTGLSISPCCYCDLLVNCTNHFFLRVFCAVLPKCHTGDVSTFHCGCTRGDLTSYPLRRIWFRSSSCELFEFDEDINTIVTPTAPTVTYTGPITRARARQLNYQVLL